MQPSTMQTRPLPLGSGFSLLFQPSPPVSFNILTLGRRPPICMGTALQVISHGQPGRLCPAWSWVMRIFRVKSGSVRLPDTACRQSMTKVVFVTMSIERAYQDRHVCAKALQRHHASNLQPQSPIAGSGAPTMYGLWCDRLIWKSGCHAGHLPTHTHYYLTSLRGKHVMINATYPSSLPNGGLEGQGARSARCAASAPPSRIPPGFGRRAPNA
ncbi:hypothetical protein LX32DRAFT_148821 [Colletotrichum zoysiae]|uniref:Uncharacterized protein n=1 Tax=Colletotrichum zoysiae TaxID=1216348 RepID=A0AAD9H8K6_9PEZI|nr:hypothetical protein LX32DRAFT_148821 [Colletotrichum zoysiae]